ncbi:hypothetical protein GYMLUDRAFT_98220 [Collybiopsis luxurians FD-317 M1]|uniref:Uncharacterized protein n=1 Tax=Collybiopsis luxurians FD-317 M1 TaxID=944289 RepID=A0A0D0C712_9AGAR|nr:hypothetical protein GYMLUDRAFT_98220 [Collybiopsis luxurians FD-317 M1]
MRFSLSVLILCVAGTAVATHKAPMAWIENPQNDKGLAHRAPATDKERTDMREGIEVLLKAAVKAGSQLKADFEDRVAADLRGYHGIWTADDHVHFTIATANKIRPGGPSRMYWGVVEYKDMSKGDIFISTTKPDTNSESGLVYSNRRSYPAQKYQA